MDFLTQSQASLKTLAIFVSGPLSTSYKFPGAEKIYIYSNSKADIENLNSLFPGALAIFLIDSSSSIPVDSCGKGIGHSVITRMEQLFQSSSHLNRFVMHNTHGFSQDDQNELATRNIAGDGHCLKLTELNDQFIWKRLEYGSKEIVEIEWKHLLLDSFFQYESFC